MTLRLVQRGQPGGDVVIVYHSGASDSALVGAAPEATVFVETFPGFNGNYANPSPVSEAIGIAGGSGRVILAGWSEGCQGIRSQLRKGEVPSACIAVDGIHAERPPNVATQIDPWRRYRDLAIGGEAIFFVSHSSIVTPYLSTTETAALLRTPDLHPVESVAGGETEADGLFFLDAFPGKNAEAHLFQGRTVLPAGLAVVIASTPPGFLRRRKLSRGVKLIAGGAIAAAVGFVAYKVAER